MLETQIAAVFEDPTSRGSTLFTTHILLSHPSSHTPPPSHTFTFDSSSHDQTLEYISTICSSIITQLYAPFPTTTPQIFSVTLHVRDFDGLAYTCENPAQGFKEIHLSTRYICKVYDDIVSSYTHAHNLDKESVIDGTDFESWNECIKKLGREIDGVLWHEMVHVWQFDGMGNCDGGLIEGVADFVRLKVGLGAEHWERDSVGKWNEGYSKTAYFLEWVDGFLASTVSDEEENVLLPSPIPKVEKLENSELKYQKANFVQLLNSTLADRKYSDSIFKDLTGMSVQTLWKKYQSSMNPQYEDAPIDKVTGWPQIEYLLDVRDINSPGSKLIAENMFNDQNPISWLENISLGVLKILYEKPEHVPKSIHRVTFIVRNGVDGAAYTIESSYATPTGVCKTKRAKEIHLSAKYVESVYKRIRESDADGMLDESERVKLLCEEINGVSWHEMVHVWQANGLGTLPHGLIEGIADYVRIKSGFTATHWKRQKGGKWEDGYATTGYFLTWIESESTINQTHQVHSPTSPSYEYEGSVHHQRPERYTHFVQRLNASVIDAEWSDDMSFSAILGPGCDHISLWNLYQMCLKGEWEEIEGPIGEDGIPRPALIVEVKDEVRIGSKIFLRHIGKAGGNAVDWLAGVSNTVMNLLYKENEKAAITRRIHSIKLIVRGDLEGVAYTTEVEIFRDDEKKVCKIGKEIHMSASYIEGVAKRVGVSVDDGDCESPEWKQISDEIDGVACHEMVHVWQQRGQGRKAPSGVIEGIADYVRLRAGLGAKHWHENPGGKWDGGYSTTAYFLRWIEDVWTPKTPEEKSSVDFVSRLNATLAQEAWDSKLIGKLLVEREEERLVDELFAEYQEWIMQQK